MEQLNIICEPYLIKNILSRFQPADHLRFFAPEETRGFLACGYDLRAVYEVYRGFAGRSFPYAWLLTENAAFLKDDLSREGSLTLKAGKLQEIRGLLLRKGLFSHDSIHLHMLREHKTVLAGIDELKSLKAGLSEAGIRTETMPLEFAKPSAGLIRFPDFTVEAEEAVNRIGLLIKDGVSPACIGVSCPSDLTAFFASLGRLAGLRFSEPGPLISSTPFFKETIAGIGEMKALAGLADDGFSGALKSAVSAELGKYGGFADDSGFIRAGLTFWGDRTRLQGESGIRLVSDLTGLIGMDYAFVLGLSDSYPAVGCDCGYLSEGERERFSLFETGYAQGAYEAAAIRQALSLLSHPSFSCSDRDPVNGQKGDSPLISEGFLASEDFSPLSEKRRISRDGDLMLYGIMDSDYRAYGEDSSFYRILGKSLRQAYAPFFPDNANPRSEMKSPLVFSFTSLSDYAVCPYMYMVRHVYKIRDDSAGDYYIKIGNLAHKVFESYGRGSVISYREALAGIGLDEKALSPQEGFYMARVYSLVTAFLPELDKFSKASGLRQTMAEKEFSKQYDSDGDILAGKIDAVYEREDGFAVFDYKTGNHLFSLDDAVNGFDMQLPFYASEIQAASSQGKKPLGMYFLIPFSPSHPFLYSDCGTFSGYTVADGRSRPLFDNASDLQAMSMYISPHTHAPLLPYEELLKRVDADIACFVEGIRAGRFPVTRKKYVKGNGEVKRSLCDACPYEDCCYVKDPSDQVRYLHSLSESEDREDDDSDAKEEE